MGTQPPLKTALVLVACAAALAACGENDNQREVRATATRFYDALKRHDARTACRLVSPTVASAMLRGTGEAGKPCAAGLQDYFRRVARGPNPHLFDTAPKVVAVVVRGERALVTLSLGPLRRHMNLARAGDRWQITVPPDFR